MADEPSHDALEQRAQLGVEVRAGAAGAPLPSQGAQAASRGDGAPEAACVRLRTRSARTAAPAMASRAARPNG